MSELLRTSIRWIHDILNKSWILWINPELSHWVAMFTLDRLEKIEFILNVLKNATDIKDENKVKIWPLILKNPVWVSAWFVKESHWLKVLEALWFWYITIWWITKDKQSWNHTPRIFRFDSDNNVVNWMWLPWKGVLREIKRLERRKKDWMMPNIPIIANLCNSLSSQTDEQKIDEFKSLISELYGYVDWFEINISCPNQWWVCDIQTQESKLRKLLEEIIKLRDAKYNSYYRDFWWKWAEKKSIIVKIAPLTQYGESSKKIKDLSLEWLDIIARVCSEVWVDAVTATNTSQEHNYWLRTQIIKKDWKIIYGWLSWLGLHERSLETVRVLRESLNKAIPIIWVWWIWYDNWQSWVEMMKAWADAIWLYSAFVQNNIMTPYDLRLAILEAKKSWLI